MNKAKTFVLIMVGLAILIGLGPFAVPVPPLQDLQPIKNLTDPDSLFVKINGLTVHYKETGSGEPVFILLHGFGASTYSWREVMQPLSEIGRVVAYDRPAFGLTERPMPGEWKGMSPYGTQAQVELLIGLMDALNIEKAIWVGNSAGGTIALQAALTYPDRVQSLVLVDAAVYTGNPMPEWVSGLLRSPQMRHLGPLVARRIQASGVDFLKTAWHDPGKLTPEVIEAYQKPLKVANWDRALWELTVSDRGEDLINRLGMIDLPVLVITGDDDRIVPTQQSIQLASAIHGAKLSVLPECGHLPQEECPDEFMQSILAFIR